MDHAVVAIRYCGFAGQTVGNPGRVLDRQLT